MRDWRVDIQVCTHNLHIYTETHWTHADCCCRLRLAKSQPGPLARCNVATHPRGAHRGGSRLGFACVPLPRLLPSLPRVPVPATDLTSYTCTSAPRLCAGASSAMYAGATMADAPTPRPTTNRPTTSALKSRRQRRRTHGRVFVQGAGAFSLPSGQRGLPREYTVSQQRPVCMHEPACAACVEAAIHTHDR